VDNKKALKTALFADFKAISENAQGRNRTGMILLSLDFESSASTNFAT
jgi:hypothetical protein